MLLPQKVHDSVASKGASTFWLRCIAYASAFVLPRTWADELRYVHVTNSTSPFFFSCLPVLLRSALLWCRHCTFRIQWLTEVTRPLMLQAVYTCMAGHLYAWSWHLLLRRKGAWIFKLRPFSRHAAVSYVADAVATAWYTRRSCLLATPKPGGGPFRKFKIMYRGSACQKYTICLWDRAVTGTAD